MAEQQTMIRAVGAAEFAGAVLERSRTVPVVVDFWAAWCGPCQALAPLVERLAAEYAGRADFVKVDTDAESALAARYGVRSLPTLALYKNGELADALIGAQPERIVRVLLERHVEQPGDRERAAALAAACSGDVDGAVATLAALAAAAPDRPEHLLALIDVLLDAGRVDEAARHLEAAPLRLRGDAEFAVRGARLELARAAQAGDVPGTPTARHAAAAREFLAGQHASALETWLELLRTQPGLGGGAVPRALKAAFRLLGDEHELVAGSRRRMASLMH